MVHEVSLGRQMNGVRRKRGAWGRGTLSCCQLQELRQERIGKLQSWRGSFSVPSAAAVLFFFFPPSASLSFSLPSHVFCLFWPHRDIKW